ncbi:MAG: SET domain-containing protein [Bacteroidetes bacterium]|nr:SET domain-containing protein [Bacteroidota bacterium]
MALLEKYLYTKRSTLPGAGKGLFTKVPIRKGKKIVEYKGEVMTWKEVEKMSDDRNGYVFYFNRNYVIDAWKTKKSVAHYANDAKGIVRIKGIRNNSEYETEGKRCFIVATEDIPARAEILVDYGKEYWQAIRYNIHSDQRAKQRAGKSGKKVTLPHHMAAKRQKKSS